LTPNPLKPLADLVDDLGKYARDPYGWVLFAFPWGERELAGYTGPDAWQKEILIDIGRRLNQSAGHFEGLQSRIAGYHSASPRDHGLPVNSFGESCVTSYDGVSSPSPPDTGPADPKGSEEALASPPIREATASGHGIGKSALVAWLILWAVSTFEDTKGVVTANTERQLKTKTWSELAKWFRLCWFTLPVPLNVPSWSPSPWWTWQGEGLRLFELTAAAVSSTHPAHQKIWRIDQVTWSERNTEAFAGLHNKGRRILLLYDEASAIPDLIWEVSEGALTDEATEIVWCVFGNPTRNTGRFKDCFTGKLKHRWSTRQIDSRSCALTNKQQIRHWAEDYGEDSDFFKVRVRGIFPSMSAKQFISVADIDAAYGRHLQPGQFDFAPKILTCDPAWEGDDELVIGLRQGLAFKILRAIPKNDNDIQVASIIANLEDSEGADAVFIDAGYGTGIVSAGRTLGRNWQLVWFSGESSDPGCLNKRAEMWKAMRDWLKAGGAIPKDTVLYNDLIGPETVARMDGKIQIESKNHMKERGLKSPNRADCLAISFAYPVSARAGRHNRPARALTEYDPFRGVEAGGILEPGTGRAVKFDYDPLGFAQD
jgi:hypothetical protein